MIQVDNLPAKLRETGLFCCWQYERRDGKPTKVPHNPRSGGRAQSTNPATFAPLPVALKSLERGKYSGIGVGVFGTLGAIDIDHCISDTGELSELASDVMEVMQGYTETSPSGKGLRILFSVPGNFRYDKARYFINNQKAGLEVYISGVTHKFVTVTGSTLTPGADLEDRGEQLAVVLEKYMVRSRQTAPIQQPKQPVTLDDAALIEKIRRSKNGGTFAALWSGDIRQYRSHSEADIALCNILAFWTNKDAGRMDRLFRQSGLYREDKWNRRQSGSTYGTITILNSINTCRGGYDPPGSFGGFGGFGESQKSENKNVFSEFLEFSGPDLSKNPKFPATEFSRELRNFSVCSGSSLQTAVDMPAVASLAMASVCAQRKFKVHPQARHYEPINLYTAVVAKPSERKSPTLDLAAAPLYEYQRTENERRRPQVEEFRDKQDMLKRRIESLKKSATSTSKKAKNDSPC